MMRNNGIKRANGALVKRRASVILVYKYKSSFHKNTPIMAVLQNTIERYLNL